MEPKRRHLGSKNVVHSRVSKSMQICSNQLCSTDLNAKRTWMELLPFFEHWFVRSYFPFWRVFEASCACLKQKFLALDKLSLPILLHQNPSCYYFPITFKLCTLLSGRKYVRGKWKRYNFSVHSSSTSPNHS